jgi:hypothetical protein
MNRVAQLYQALGSILVTSYESQVYDGDIRNFGCVLGAAWLNGSLFWDIRECSPVKVSHHFGRTWQLQLKGGRESGARFQHEVNST